MRILARLGLAVGGFSLCLSATASAQAPASRGEVSIPTGVVVSASEAPAMEAQLRRLGPPTVVSQGTVVPGTVIMQSGSVPGRAVATDAPGYEHVAQPGEPEPIGVMRTNYANSPAAGMANPAAMPGSSPYNPAMGRHGVPMAAGAGSNPFLPSSEPPRPRVIAHLFGLEGIGNSFRDARAARIEARKRREILNDYYASHKIDEVPASVIYGRSKKGH